MKNSTDFPVKAEEECDEGKTCSSSPITFFSDGEMYSATFCKWSSGFFGGTEQIPGLFGDLPNNIVSIDNAKKGKW